MNLLGLPQEVLVHILLQLDTPSLLVCGQVNVFAPYLLPSEPLLNEHQVCHYCKTLLELSALQYKYALARSGKVDGPATGVPVKDRLAALERYEEAWHAATQIQDPQLPATRPQSYRCLPFSGSAIPFISGRELKLYLPASPTRRIRSKVWSFDLEGIQIDAAYCTTDLSQNLLVLCGQKAAPTNVYECHILSLSDAVIVPEGAAAIPILTVAASTPSVSQDNENLKVVVCGDLLAWTWVDDLTHLRVFNWKSGQVVWSNSHDYLIYFAFLGQRCLAVAHHCAEYLRVYTIDPDTPAQMPLPAQSELPDVPDMRIFLLPPTEDAYDCYACIQGIASSKPSGRSDQRTLFVPDPASTVLAIVLQTASHLPYSNIVWRPGSQDYIVVIPTRTLLAHTEPATASKSYPPISSDHPSPHGPIPWQSWGESCSRLLPITPRLRWISSGLHVVGSKCLIVSGRPHSEAVLDIFVCDFHPFAEDNRTEGEDQDRATAHLYMDTSNVLTGVETLKGPIRNRLPFRVVHKVVKYDPAITYQWGNLSTALLEDGVVCMVRRRHRSSF
ncbi:hypothetical protein TRAPUB_11188 [Trametes pubescens]|uniref:F-box domain-containing protein n=1 Tax=Trametes pubescens TaxID=154538 RepID=A0A1M2VXB8_TRAPU|nr:hypothetical protein TRAPUB_11188 [Trametes pubescens]